MREALRALDLSEKLHPPRRILSRISARKNSRRLPKGAPNNSGRAPDEVSDDSFGAETFARIAERYGQTLEAARAVDFDDLLLKTLDLLAGNAVVRESYRRRFPYVLVDEYQDTNSAQYEIIRHLVGERGNVTVVGDEDQSIYSWRGADIQNILDFEHDFPGARVFRLERNYRSSQAILDTASALVAHNLRRKGKTLRAVRAAGAPVRLHTATDEYEEAAWVVDRIASERSGRGRAAILFRMNAQSRLFEEALLRRRLPYVVVGGVGFYERREVKDLLSYLRLVLNPEDTVALRRVLNVPPRGIGAKSLEEIERAAKATGASLWEALGTVVDEARLPARATQPLARFRELLESLREEAPRLTVKGLITRVLEASGYAAALAQEDSQESQDRLENLAELISAAADYDAREPSLGLPGFLDQTALVSEVDELGDDAPVVLLTFHAAKGLEFDSVFLVGLEEGLMPHSRSLDRRRGARGGAAALLRGDDPGHGAPVPEPCPEPSSVRAAAARRAQPFPGRDPRRRARSLGGIATGVLRHAAHPQGHRRRPLGGGRERAGTSPTRRPRGNPARSEGPPPALWCRNRAPQRRGGRRSEGDRLLRRRGGQAAGRTLRRPRGPLRGPRPGVADPRPPFADSRSSASASR